MLLAFWNCISIPFDVAFEPPDDMTYVILEYIIDVCFFIDIIVAFRTTFTNEKTGFPVVKPWDIAKNYILSGRFFVDLAASIPFENVYTWFVVVVENSSDNDLTRVKLLGLLKLVRLLRLGRIIRYMKFK